jgi:hypothetical protein
MFKDPTYVMMVDEKTVKHVSEIEGESMSIYALLRAGASTMCAKRMRTPAALLPL